MMKTHRPNRLFAGILLLAVLCRPVAHAQTGRNDPTVPTAEMTDTLRAQLAEFRAITIHALVVGTDGAGIAILTAFVFALSSVWAPTPSLAMSQDERGGWFAVLGGVGLAAVIVIAIQVWAANKSPGVSVEDMKNQVERDRQNCRKECGRIFQECLNYARTRQDSNTQSTESNRCLSNKMECDYPCNH